MGDLLPVKPVTLKFLDPWWTVHVGFVTEDDVKVDESLLSMKSTTSCHVIFPLSSLGMLTRGAPCY